MPTVWWLRPVSSAARVGEHQCSGMEVGVTKTVRSKRIKCWCPYVAAVAAKLRETDIIEQNHHDVG